MSSLHSLISTPINHHN